MSENIKKGIRNWLQESPVNYGLSIMADTDHELYAIKNRIWWRGDCNELEQMYQQNSQFADRNKFWACKSSPGMDMRKLHVGIPSLMVRVLVNIVMNDMNDFEFKDQKNADIWEQIAKENRFNKLMDKALSETLVVGDGAFKIVINTMASEYPIIQWYPGDLIDIVHEYGRLKEIVFKTLYEMKGRRYVLHERYGYGYVESNLYVDEKEVPLNAIDETSGLQPRIEYQDKIMLAAPLMVYDSAKFEGRGGSIFDGKLDSFDALDETWSQWMDALRAGRAKTYIPDNLIPRDPETGAFIKSNPFDNRFIAIGADMSEGTTNKVDTEQPSIPHDSYLASYCTALDLCLQGVISPSTLGIDNKKLDNAEAQREKEKTTLYTRGNIIGALKETLEELVSASINAFNILNGHPVEEVQVDIEWGEYASPSFDSQVETIAKAKTGGIMSIDRCVEELYGNSMDDHCKAEEIARLKAEQGVEMMEEPSLNLEGVSIEGENSEQNIPPGEGGVPTPPAGGQ
jgi:hypothetical protein